MYECTSRALETTDRHAAKTAILENVLKYFKIVLIVQICFKKIKYGTENRSNSKT